jgi:hypothetical protein
MVAHINALFVIVANPLHLPLDLSLDPKWGPHSPYTTNVINPNPDVLHHSLCIHEYPFMTVGDMPGSLRKSPTIENGIVNNATTMAHPTTNNQTNSQWTRAEQISSKNVQSVDLSLK